MKPCLYIDNDSIYIVVLTNCVPAVAVIRKRLVLFILIRFKGYLNGQYSLIKCKYMTRVICKKAVLEEER